MIGGDFMRRRALTVAAALVVAPIHFAFAVDTGDTACKTTQECKAEADKIMGAITQDATSGLAKAQDQFYWMNRINMASTVMLVEEKIIPSTLAKPIAEGVNFAMAQATQPGGRRPDDVLQLERIISEKSGPEATLVHTGRSRQDMYAAIRVMQLRREFLDMGAALLRTRALLLEVAAQHTETFVPAYTNGVQAQPISYGHYLMAFADSLARDAQRLRETYARINLSPMGTAVLANSSWPLNRGRLADLLGFDGLVTNSYDSGQVIVMDVPLEAAAIAGNVALRLGSMLQDIHTQYHQTRPWLLLDDGSTYTSSAMPQKRNPGVIMTARAKASDVSASLQTAMLRLHNVTPGMIDFKATTADARTFILAVEMLNRFNGVMKALRINAARAEELDNDWTTSMELAETLQRLHNVPFRVGHTFASGVVDHAKANNLLPKQFPYAEAVRIYAGAAQKYKLAGTKLPLDEIAFRKTLAPDDMVRTRVGVGGPQPAEVVRMIATGRQALAQDTAWLDERNTRLLEAEAKLNAAFARLLAN